MANQFVYPQKPEGDEMTTEQNLSAGQIHLKQAADYLRDAYAHIDPVGELVLAPILAAANEAHDKLARLRHAQEVRDA